MILIADASLEITDASLSSCVGRSRTVETRRLDDKLGTCLPDSIPGMDRAEALDVCRTILSGERFPGGFESYRKGAVILDPIPERRVFVLSPRLEDGRISGVVCRISSTFLQHPQADELTAQTYQAMVENCMEFMFVIDELGFHTYVSPTIRATMGEQPDNVYGMHLSDVVHPDDVERCHLAIDKLASGGPTIADIRYRLILPDGTQRHIAVSGHRFDTGAGVRCMGVAKDITETMELRAKLDARQEALAALSRIVLTLSGKGSLDDALQSALAEILAFLKLRNGGINVLSSDGSELIAGALAGTPRPPIPPQVLLQQLNALCPNPGEVQIVSDVASDSRLDSQMRGGLMAIGVHGFALARFQSMLGQHACMAMDIPANGDLSLEQMEFLNLATGILGPAIENAVLQGELADRADQLAMLERMALSINSGLDVPSVFTACQATLRELIECDEVSLVVFGAGRIADTYAFLGTDDLVHDRRRLSGQQLQEFSAMTRTHDLRDSCGLRDYCILHRDHPVDSGSIACTPLIYKGAVTGLLKIRALRDNAFGSRETSILQSVAEHLAIAVANARLYEAEHARTLELEALGREMQHRIKNNLQSIAGLLSISSHDSTASARAVERCLGQVQAISTVHSLLTPKRMKPGIRLRKLLSEIAEATVTAADRGEEITLTVEGDDCRLSPDTAVALGVIANELVSNALEHGLAGRRAGSIRVSAATGPTHVTVEFRDDGEGLPDGFRMPTAANSGLGLVASLTKHGLHGEFDISSSDSGTVARIEF